MDEIRFVSVTLDMYYEEIFDSNRNMFYEEYHKLSEYRNSDIDDWLKKAQAKGLTDDSDKVIINLLVELHKKMDKLEHFLKGNENKNIYLHHSAKIIGINFEYIKTDDLNFLEDKKYYARIEMPTFPKREIPLFLTGVNANIAKIILIGQKNLEDWNSFIMAKERENIRELKRSKYDS